MRAVWTAALMLGCTDTIHCDEWDGEPLDTHGDYPLVMQCEGDICSYASATLRDEELHPDCAQGRTIIVRWFDFNPTTFGAPDAVSVNVETLPLVLSCNDYECWSATWTLSEVLVVSRGGGTYLLDSTSRGEWEDVECSNVRAKNGIPVVITGSAQSWTLHNLWTIDGTTLYLNCTGSARVRWM